MKITADILTAAAVDDILTDALPDSKPQTDAQQATEPAQPVAPAEPQARAAAYYARCRQQLLESPDALEWLSAHGFDEVPPDIGFVPAWTKPGLKARADGWTPAPTPRIIVPVSENNYVALDIRAGLSDSELKYSCMNVGQPDIYGNLSDINGEYVTQVYIVDDVLDALSAQTVAPIPVLALNTSTNTATSAKAKLLAYLSEHPTQAALILCGKAAQGLTDELRRLNVAFVISKIKGSVNAALTQSRDALMDAMQADLTEKADSTYSYIDNLMAADIERFKRNPARKTGFINFDGETGGLHPGLYVLAAVSSLGKTTWALQVADYLAATGSDVIFFSLEQSRLELVSKSLSRIVAQESMKDKVSSLAIRQGYMPRQVEAAIKTYKRTVSNRLQVIEGNFNCDVGYIADYIRAYMARTGTAPVCFIDYLQILQPSADGKLRNSKREEVDLCVTELKRLSRELNITIFVISSLNRTNYLMPVAFESIKESGNIEYCADVVLGLQLACLDEDIFSKDTGIKAKRERERQAKAEYPRKVKLTCLKNRYGRTGFDCMFSYYTDCDLLTAQPTPATNSRR